ncbi:TAXI family TRAP transporter solute-binding subunit [Marinibacterium sp. SX1]|uniref:TAXI family TRAP transporter solute-binding subunit n=1 Tax=Marinibacterium sp. SX1 TaxID=3388424 RepID=UPI003D16E31F
MTLPTRLLWSLLIAACLVGGVTWAILLLRPPNQLTLAAGPEDGAYHRIAVQYRAILARDDIALRILETAGSAENARLLADGTADVAILQGGIDVAGETVEAIGTIFYEPLVLLYAANALISPNPTHWAGLRINSGVEGSGTRAAFDAFEQAVGLRPDANEHSALGYSDSIAALLDGQLDLAVFVAPIDAPYLRAAFESGAIGVLQLDFIEAISRRMDNASLVQIPPGTVSLDPPIPSGPRQMLALEARLAVRHDMHPALMNRLTMAALELHGGRDILQDEGDFPSVSGTVLPVNNSARQLIVNGPSTWHDWLPYWMAAQLNRVVILLLPLFFIVLPLLRALPGLYAYAQNYRVWQNYPVMRTIEDELESGSDPVTLDEMAERLTELDDHLAHLRLPAAYRQTAFQARVHIDLLQRRIITERRRLAAEAEETASVAAGAESTATS